MASHTQHPLRADARQPMSLIVPATFASITCTGLEKLVIAAGIER